MTDLTKLREIIERQRPAGIIEHWEGTAIDYLYGKKETRNC